MSKLFKLWKGKDEDWTSPVQCRRGSRAQWPGTLSFSEGKEGAEASGLTDQPESLAGTGLGAGNMKSVPWPCPDPALASLTEGLGGCSSPSDPEGLSTGLRTWTRDCN